MKKDKLIPLLLIGIPVIFLIILGSSKKEEVVVHKTPEVKINKNTTTKTATDNKIAPYEYKIVYESSKVRFDGGRSYYVLIDPVDLKDSSFKDKIKATIKDVIEKTGTKISVDIVDDKDTMDLYYKSHYVTNSLGRILNKSELDKLAIHLISSYSGEERGMQYKNQLDFFPGAFKDNVIVGKYVETINFDTK